MCQTKYWKSIEFRESANAVVARRSDSTIFFFYLEEFRDIPDFVSKLEEFRICNCLPKTPCNKHLEESERINATI